ncbi:MAG: prolipoprotein diacylglyceryl transferase [Vicinamibacterales bacterium]|nr:prolipoprotein diacylglyceryl transferase [Vicinamibacterales bacterium]
MHPILLELGPLTIYSYGVFLASAYLLGLWMAVRRANAAGLDGNRVLDLGIWVIIAALVGAKALLFIVDFQYFTSSWDNFMTLVRSGGVFYGGLIAAVVVCIYQLRKHRLPLWVSGDLFAPGIALGYMVGRLGCLLAGCCYGRPTEVAWAITFTDPAAALNVGTPLNVALHPTQLYEAAAGLVILVTLLATEGRGRQFAGRTFWQFVLIYSVLRFGIEYFRGDPRGDVFAMLSTSQFISLVLFPLSLVMLWYLGRPSAGAPPASQAPARPRKPRFS